MAPFSVPLVLPVRFSGGGLAMQTTTSRLGPEGAYVRSLVSPKEGARVELWLSLPTAAEPLKIAATVAERGQEPGFLARFDALPEETAKFLLPFLQSHGFPAPAAPAAPARQPRSGAEPAGGKRAFTRLTTRIQVGWSSPKEFLVAYSENISRGGIFVATRRPPALREIVELLLELPDGQAPAKTNAEVVQCVTEEQAAANGRVAGAGLQFVGGDDEFRQRLDACIEHLLSQQG